MEAPESRERAPRLVHPAAGAHAREQGKGHLHAAPVEDAECRRPKGRLVNRNARASGPRPSRNIPRRHTLGGPRSSKEILGLQTSEMDRKREAFLEHLKQKYPHHATAIMGHQERLRDQTRSPKLSHSPQLLDPVEHLSEASGDSLDAMSEGEAPSPFSRGSRTRASLPVVRSTNQTKERSLGVLYLQYGDDTKQLRMPNEITSADTIRALFVSAFPQQLTMKMLESPSVAIYIKDESRNVYYELTDVRNIQDRSLLKVYNKDPAHAFNHTPKPADADMRMQREIIYARGEGMGSRPGSVVHPTHVIPNSTPPTPMPHSMPPSPSRIPYGGSRSTMVIPGNATIPRDRLSSLPVSRSISPSPSAILERRDVKPDEDMSGKNMALYRNEGFHVDPYLYHEGRMSIASSHGGHPLDVPDHIIAYHRTAIRSASAYCSPSLLPADVHVEQSLYREKSRKYLDSHLPTLGSKTPPASPHRVSDLRMVDMHAHHNAHGPPHTMQPDRASPSRQSFKKEPGTLVYVEKPRTAPGLPGLVDLGPPLVEKQVFAYSTATIPKDRETSEKMMKTAASRHHAESAGTPQVSAGKMLSAPEPTGPPSLPPGTPALHASLLHMRHSVVELRAQLQQMRQLQLQNQEQLRAMLKKAEQELSSRVLETVKRLEDPVQRQRVLVEQDRQKYLHEEERVVRKLGELEDFVEDLKKDSASGGRAVTLKDVEDGAFLLRQVGEAVAALKGEFPALQNRMRAVLRVEVEAVRFLKEEPHRLDGLLQRVRSMTDVLTTLRRHVTDGLLKGADAAQAAQYAAMEKAAAADVLRARDEPPAGCAGVPGDVKAEVVPLSIHHAHSAPVLMHSSQLPAALLGPAQHPPASPPAAAQDVTPAQPAAPGLTPAQLPANDSPAQTLLSEDMQSSGHKAANTEKAERKWEERRQNPERCNGKEFEKLLEEAQASMMKSIPDLEMPPAPGPPPKGDAPADRPEVLEESPNSEQDVDKSGGKSPPPPPPPPRRSYLPGLGLTTTRSGDVVYTSRKEAIGTKASEEPGPSPQPRGPAEEPVPPPVSSKDEEEDEEGDKIMAELQAFQKCPLVDVNSHSHAEQSRADSHLKDPRPGAPAPPTEKKNLEFFHEDVRKSDVEHEHGPRMESGKVLPGHLPPRAHPEWENGVENGLPHAPRTTEHRGGGLSQEHSWPDSTLTDHRNSCQNAGPQLSSGASSLEDTNQGPTASDPENQKLSYGKTKDRSPQGEEHADPLVPPGSLGIPEGSSQEPGALKAEFGQVVLRPKVARVAPTAPAEDGDSTAGSPTEESAGPDNIAFMITKTAVQVLSSGEVRDIVSRKGEDVQTVNIDARRATASAQGGAETEEPVVCLDKKPVIIIFDEPMDIRSAYKRLSTIFEECDEELERMMTEEKIEEEEEDDSGDAVQNSTAPHAGRTVAPGSLSSGEQTGGLAPHKSLSSEMGSQGGNQSHPRTLGSADSPGSEGKEEAPDDHMESPKKKFKFKFPKKQLAALTQAIRTGTKTGKKTLQVVVYEEEEEDGTLKQHKEAKRFEIIRSQPEDTPKSVARRLEPPGPESVSPISRTEEIRKNTYRTLDSLEQTIKQLENTISEMSPKALVQSACPASAPPVVGEAAPRSLLAPDAPSAPSSPSAIPSASRKASAAQTSRMPVPLSAKHRPGSLDKAGKLSKLQDPRQYRQANGSAKKAGGDSRPAALPASKIPAPPPGPGKSGAPGPPADAPPAPPARAAPASLIPSVANGALKLQAPPAPGRGGPAPPAPCSPPSPLHAAAKGARTLHKAQNGGAGRPAAKEAA